MSECILVVLTAALKNLNRRARGAKHNHQATSRIRYVYVCVLQRWPLAV